MLGEVVSGVGMWGSGSEKFQKTERMDVMMQG